MSYANLDDAPFLDIEDPNFSMRSQDVNDAREKAGMRVHLMV